MMLPPTSLWWWTEAQTLTACQDGNASGVRREPLGRDLAGLAVSLIERLERADPLCPQGLQRLLDHRGDAEEGQPFAQDRVLPHLVVRFQRARLDAPRQRRLPR